MKPSNSKHIALESIPLSELFKREPGSIGLYLPAPDEEGKTQASYARIASTAKRWGTTEKKHSMVQSAILLVTKPGEEVPTAQKLVQVTITSPEEMTPTAKRYREANK